MKLDRQQVRKSSCQQSFPKTLRTNKQDRNDVLAHFIEELDRTEPILQSVSHSISEYLDWLSENCAIEIDRFEENWNQMMRFLLTVKEKVMKKFAYHKKCAQTSLLSSKSKIEEENQNLSFMRNDIVKNISRIVDLKLIPENQFEEVMRTFREQLSEISESVSNLSSISFELPRIQIDLPKLELNLENFAVVNLERQ